MLHNANHDRKRDCMMPFAKGKVSDNGRKKDEPKAPKKPSMFVNDLNIIGYVKVMKTQ